MGTRPARGPPGAWKYLKVTDREFLFDLDYDPRERTDFARKEPARLDALRQLHAEWNEGMLPPLSAQAPPQAGFREMLW